jgi:hypothetical protein
MQFTNGRTTDPSSIDDALIDQMIADGQAPIIQFRQKCYTAQMLAQIEGLCQKHGSQIEVRFFGHNFDYFDANTLDAIPSVQNLSVDCMDGILNEGAFSRLQNLRKLSVGIYKFDRPDFLNIVDLTKLEQFSISENAKRNFDLVPLANAQKIRRLYIQGHSKNIEVLTKLSDLKILTLGSLAKQQSLDFVFDIAELKELELLLGGREDISDLRHDSLEILQILRVKGVNDLGSFVRFPKLRHLRVEDQIQLSDIDLTDSNMKRLSIANCKNLSSVNGLLDQSELEELWISKTAIDLEPLRGNQWPASLKTLGLFSEKTKWNKETQALLEGRGFKTYGTPWF